MSRSIPLVAALLALTLPAGAQFANPWTDPSTSNPSTAEPRIARATADPLGAERIDYIAHQMLGLVDDSRKTMPDEVGPDSLKIELSTNKPAYDIGEPIAVTFSVTNLGKAPVAFETGGDYRPGREGRFALSVTDASGARAPDPLALRISYGMAGGLGGEKELAPRETWTQRLLLQLYACPRKPGTYTLQASYTYGPQFDPSRALQSAPAAFSVRDRRTTITNSGILHFLKENGLEHLHPALLWGLRGRKEDIPALIQVLRTGEEPRGYAGSPSDLAKRNAKADAGLGLALMPWKNEVYEALSKTVADGAVKDGYDLIRITYWTSGGPGDVEAVEKHLDDADPEVRRLALRAALMLGGRRALEQLPAALGSSDEEMRMAAAEGATSHLFWGFGLANLRMDGLSMANVEAYRAALSAGAAKEPSSKLLLRYVSALMLGPGPPPALLETIRNEKDPERRKSYLEAVKLTIVLHDEPFARESQNGLVSLGRDLMERSDELDVAAGLTLLGLLDDRESVEPIARKLDSPSEEIRVAAAAALFILRDRSHMDRRTATLAEASNPASSCFMLAGRRWFRSGSPDVFHPGNHSLEAVDGQRPPVCGKYDRYIHALRRRTLELMDKIADGGTVKRAPPGHELMNTGQCPSDPSHRWQRLLGSAALFSPWCPVCGADLEMRKAL